MKKYAQNNCLFSKQIVIFNYNQAGYREEIWLRKL